MDYNTFESIPVFQCLVVSLVVALFALGSLISKRIGIHKFNLGGQFQAVVVGMIGGMVLCILWLLIWQVSFLQYPLTVLVALKLGFTLISGFSGLWKGFIDKDWSRYQQAWKLFWGQFYVDPNRNSFKQLVQLILRFSWELVQTELGYNYSQLRNAFGRVSQVHLFGGMTYAVRCFATRVNGVSIGNSININQRTEHCNFINSFLLMHEYGHTFQSQIWGPGYLFFIGIPSLYSALFTNDHHNRWYEKQTDQFAESYFTKHFGVGYRRNKF